MIARKHSVLVVGAGIAGAAVARRLGHAGLEVHLVEKADLIGGQVREFGCKADDACVRCNVCVANEVLRSVRYTPNLQTYLDTEVTAIEPAGHGGYRARLQRRGAEPDGTAVEVDDVVLAIGYQPFDPAENSRLGYGRVPNVITGAEAERQLARQHRITRPSDGQTPRRVAFVQCVGSRTEEIHRRPEDTDYCSRVCCAYALRMARKMKHQSAESEITIFYMDIQRFGKGFDEFYRECRDRMRFVRSRPYEMDAGPDGSVLVTYTPEAGAGERVAREAFDLVVLAVGIRPAADTTALAGRLGIAVDPQGFLGLKGAAPLPDLQKPSVYVVGACEAPKDIEGCLAQAEAVSAAILASRS